MFRIGHFLLAVAIFVLVIITTLTLTALTLHKQAQADAGQVSAFDYLEVDIDILNNSDMEITETHKYSFITGTFHYGYRWIPLDAVESIDSVEVGEDGQLYTQDPAVQRWIKDYQTMDESPPENYYAYCTWIEGDKLWIGWWYPETTGGSRVFELRYTVRGGLQFHEDGDQLYWVAIFSDRDKAIGRTKVTVHLPEPVSPAQLIVDSYGIEAQTNTVDERTIEFTTGSVPYNAELIIRVIIPHGVINALPPDMQKPRGIGGWIVDKVSAFGIINLCLGGLGTALILGGTYWIVIIRPRRTVVRNGPGYRD